MTVADVIEAARSWTAISNSSFFTSADELRSANRAYRDIYEQICDANDDFFLKNQTKLASELTVIKPNVFSFPLPADFYRIRLATILHGDDERVLSRRDVHDTGSGYRLSGSQTVTEDEASWTAQTMKLWIEQPFDSISIDYYPAPVAIASTSTVISYPPQLEPLILAYQIAIDICNINKDNADRFRAEYARLWDRFEKATKRVDNLNHVKVANVYSSGWGGW